MAGQIGLKAPLGGTVTLNAADTASNFTVTLPAATTTVVATDVVQTLTNKTLTLPTITAYTVAALPTVGTLGRLAVVTDALAPTFMATIVGGGVVKALVLDNGTNWVAL